MRVSLCKMVLRGILVGLYQLSRMLIVESIVTLNVEAEHCTAPAGCP